MNGNGEPAGRWTDLKEEISRSPGLKQRPFKSLWSHMLVTFSGEYMSALRLVAIMLLIPLDTSEAERIFSLMNTSRRPSALASASATWRT